MSEPPRRIPAPVAAKRIQAARVARRFPAVFEVVARGRIHLSGLVLLAPHLTEGAAADLLAAAEHKTKLEIERLLAERYPKSDLLPWATEVSPSFTDEHAPGHVDDAQVVAKSASDLGQLVPGRVV